MILLDLDNDESVTYEITAFDNIFFLNKFLGKGGAGKLLESDMKKKATFARFVRTLSAPTAIKVERIKIKEQNFMVSMDANAVVRNRARYDQSQTPRFASGGFREMR